LGPPTDRAPDQSAEWTSATEVHRGEERAAAERRAERRAASWNLAWAALAVGLTAAAVAGLIIVNPTVAASVETDVPAGTIELVGNVTSQPVLAKLGVLELSWNPFGRQGADPIKAQSIWLKMSLARADCERLARIEGACGAGQGPPLRHLESLRVAAADPATEPSLYASVTASTAPRFELEPIGPATHQGPPFEWSLRNHSPSLAVRLSCEHRTTVEVTALSDPPGTPERDDTATCIPGGVAYRVEILDAGPTVTNVAFHRVLHFQSKASADRGAVTIGQGTLAVDGDSGRLKGPTRVALSAAPGSTLSSSVFSPLDKASAQIKLKAPQASHAQVGGNERTPNAFERIPSEVRIAVLAPWLALLLGVSTRAIRKLRPWKGNDANED
jgi:hypothetical protein